MAAMDKERVTLKIPRPLYEKLRVIISGSGFRSVNEFVVYVLRDLVSLKKDEKPTCRQTRSRPSASA